MTVLGSSSLRRTLGSYFRNTTGPAFISRWIKTRPIRAPSSANHQGVDNRLLIGTAAIRTAARLRKRERVGGILNYYYREAARF